MEENKEKTNSILNTVLKVLLGLIVAGLVVIIIMNLAAPKSKKDPLDPSLLITFSKQVVKNNLVSPSSAEFPDDEANYKVTYNDKDNTFTIIGDVESQNSLGVMLKTQYKVIGEYDTDKKQYKEISTSFK